MKKLLGFVVLFSVLGFGFVANAQTTSNTTATTETTQIVQDEVEGKTPWDKLDGNKDSWRGFAGGKMGYGHGYKTTGGSFCMLWMIGWLFTIGYLGLPFRKGVLALIIWPYYLGKKFSKQE